MRHVLYALFRQTDQAEAALHDLEQAGLGSDVCNVVVHRDRLKPSDLNQAETDSRGGLLRGLGAQLADPQEIYGRDGDTGGHAEQNTKRHD
jgi:hypothetical protein